MASFHMTKKDEIDFAKPPLVPTFHPWGPYVSPFGSLRLGQSPFWGFENFLKPEGGQIHQRKRNSFLFIFFRLSSSLLLNIF